MFCKMKAIITYIITLCNLQLRLTSSEYSFGKGTPATTVGPPPCILRARIVATKTAAFGVRPE